MIKAACHCTAVRFEIDRPPEWVLDCNCTICRRYGAVWSYYHRGDGPQQLLSQPSADVTDTYLWGDRELAFHRCKVCGCVTHIAAVRAAMVYAVNARMMLDLNPAGVRILQVDNGHSGHFWTRSDGPPRKSEHPPMPPLGPDDWR
ncbi:MAG TPA: hypothetical protein VIO94_12355 [Phenylobacterium sp.]